MAGNINAAYDEADRVVKKQRTCASLTTDALRKLLAQLEQVHEQALADPSTSQAGLQALHKSVISQGLPGQVSKATKDLHGCVGKLGKALEKAFIQDVSAAFRDKPFDKTVLNRVIAEHFYQEGSFEVGDTFLEEAGIEDGQAIRAPYQRMHDILHQIRKQNVAGALEFVQQHREELIQSCGRDKVEAFVFSLHRLQFTLVLSREGQGAALQYARRHFAPFQQSNMEGIQRLMGCLCYLKRSNPYADLLSPERWADLHRDFARLFCCMLGQASESPLLVATAAGAVALPTLLKLAGLLKDTTHDLVTGEQLPVELTLGPEFVFRSIFACPVSREQSSPANPPMLLPCGHVLCKQSILKIARSTSRSFKCPYCPLEASMATCLQLLFPPII